MSTHAVRNHGDLTALLRLLQNRKMPFTVSIAKGAPRSSNQNRLQRLWLQELEEQGDQTAEEYRGYCKLHLGVPILRAENEEFRVAYDKIVRPLSYEDKLKIMMVPLDLPCTRIMSSEQKKRYLDSMYQHFVGLGFRLTEPERR